MNLRNISTKNLLECVHCGRHFYYKDMYIKDRQLYNVQITERCCPYCKSHETEPVKEQRRLDIYYNFATEKN